MQVHIERTDYKGWSNCWRIANCDIELIVTADVGPRVIRYGFNGGQNLFKNFDDQMGNSGEPLFMARGGSRIWIGPEDRKASYAPDNFPVQVTRNDDTLTATAPIEDLVGVQKQMSIRLAQNGTGVEICHRIRNAGLLPTEFAAWILTAMAPGGLAITGFPPRGTHPENLAPSNPLVMWAFTDLSDPRWRLQKKYLLLRQDSALPTPQKLGHFNPRTWGAYLLNGQMFLKTYKADPASVYPDLGCSFETFANGDVLELETLGPLTRVPPGEWIEHTEHWSLHRNVALSEFSDEELDRVVAPLVEAEFHT
jgi:hypothetical protein